MQVCELKRLLAIAALLVATLGCGGGPARVVHPDLDSLKIAGDLIEAHDTNGDGAISTAEELQLCKSIAESVASYDKDSNGLISHEELSTRLEEIYTTRLPFFRLMAKVTLDGRPLPGASVVLDPEPPLEGIIHPASGETDTKGYAYLGVAAEHAPPGLQGKVNGVRSGLYRISVTHASAELPSDVIAGNRFGKEITSKYANGSIDVEIKTR